MIKFEGINKWFGKLHVLRDINLHVEPGEVIVICGPSGSGKSTLIRCINRLEKFQKTGRSNRADNQSPFARRLPTNFCRRDI